MSQERRMLRRLKGVLDDEIIWLAPDYLGHVRRQGDGRWLVLAGQDIVLVKRWRDVASVVWMLRRGCVLFGDPERGYRVDYDGREVLAPTLLAAAAKVKQLRRIHGKSRWEQVMLPLPRVRARGAKIGGRE